ncbi:MAG TPA: transketolase family protein [Candidatus Paceibacterota bacterium]|nr:transketolase family protein [Candidatus Paceibacterota bacterium]
MINLNPKLYNVNVEQESLREGFGRGLLKAGEKNKDVVALCADLKESTKVEDFAREFSDRFIEVGVAEQNLVSVASGMSAMGKIPFAASYAIFSPGRNWEHIRTTICYNNANVKIIGSHAGLNVGPDGGSHQMLEDIALTRVLPNMIVVAPCDALETEKATRAIAEHVGPVYLRLARDKSPIVTTEETEFEIGKANILVEPEEAEAVIIACGLMVYRVLMAARKLEREGIKVSVVNNHTIKPLDEETILNVVDKAGAVVTCEEHQIAGGLGSVVAELLAKVNPVPMEFVGVSDRFGQSGSGAELMEHYGLGVDDIVEAVKKVIKRKNGN